MFLAGDLERDAELIERILTVLQAAEVASCPSRDPGAPPVRFGTLTFAGPERAVPEGPAAPL